MEKKKAAKSVIRKLKIRCRGKENDEEEYEISNEIQILGEIITFYKELFEKKNFRSNADQNDFLNEINVPTINEQDREMCDTEITIQNLEESLLSMENNKSPGNDGLTKEFYARFWKSLKTTLFNSFMLGKK